MVLFLISEYQHRGTLSRNLLEPNENVPTSGKSGRNFTTVSHALHKSEYIF
jgi:hypothetical protein